MSEVTEGGSEVVVNFYRLICREKVGGSQRIPLLTKITVWVVPRGLCLMFFDDEMCFFVLCRKTITQSNQEFLLNYPKLFS